MPVSSDTYLLQGGDYQTAQGGVATGITAAGYISYNGYTLAGPRNSVQLEITPVRDSTGRYVTHSVYRYSIDAWITYTYDESDPNYGLVEQGANNGRAATLHSERLQALLSQDGGELIITGFGFGDVTVNADSYTRDVEWGPKTRHLKLRNIGFGCVVVMWIVEVCLKKCQSGVISPLIGLMKEYVYQIGWSIKPNGCTIRTVRGHVEIFLATQSVGGGSLGQTADNFRDNIRIPIQPGFIRTVPQEFQLSENKQRLMFSVIDEEQESDNAYPNGVADMDMDHTVTCNPMGTTHGVAGPQIQNCSMSGYVAMAKPYSTGYGYIQVLRLMQERIVHAFNQGGAPVLTEIKISESVFQRKLSFGIRYLIIQDKGKGDIAAISDIVQVSGLFRGFTSTNQLAYQDSMQTAWSNRGNMRMTHVAGSDILQETCNNNESQEVTILDSVNPLFFSSSTAAFFLECPPANRSRVYFENVAELSQYRRSIRIQEMPKTAEPYSPSTTEKVAGMDMVQPDGARVGESLGSRSALKSIQKIGDGSAMAVITIRGRAKRVGYPIEIPEVATVCGRNPGFDLLEDTTSNTVVGYVNGKCPVYEGSWYRSYTVLFKSLSALNSALSSFNSLEDVVYKTPSGSNPK